MSFARLCEKTSFNQRLIIRRITTAGGGLHCTNALSVKRRFGFSGGRNTTPPTSARSATSWFSSVPKTRSQNDSLPEVLRFVSQAGRNPGGVQPPLLPQVQEGVLHQQPLTEVKMGDKPLFRSVHGTPVCPKCKRARLVVVDKGRIFIRYRCPDFRCQSLVILAREYPTA